MMHTQRLTDGWKIGVVGPEETGTSTWSSEQPPNATDAPVPGIIQQVFPDHHGLAWYWCTFSAPELCGDEGLLLSFEAVDYACTIWINGTKVGSHEGAETPFSIDITRSAKPGSVNLLAVRVLNPTVERIDGMVLDEVPHANKADVDFWPGRGYNSGGIIGEVRLQVVPVVRIERIFAVPMLANGQINTHIEISNRGEVPSSATLNVTARESQSGVVVARSSQQVRCEPGRLEATAVLTIGSVRLWDLDDPFLYTLSAALSDGDRQSDELTISTGFREFRVENGFFRLNGRRIYLRSTHTGNHYPLGQKVPPRLGFVRQDLIYAKAAGFNMVRFIAGLARPDQLAFCDELGLLVYEEPASAWCLADSPEMVNRFDDAVREMVLRDRNHPSVVIWGLLNETRDGAVFRHAVESLAAVRSLDESRLVLLSSGRWDADLSIGSVANPGHDTWQHEWGLESPSAPATGADRPTGPDKFAYVPGAGDLHFYPRLPESAAAEQVLRTMGEATKPVFLSEYGVGSLFDAVTETADAARWVDGVVPPDLALTRSMAERFAYDWAAFGMEEVYCFPQDAARASQLHQSQRRAVSFDLIRSNPNVAGYNLTGMLDHALTGEGSWTFWRRWKPGAVEALSDGWSPLRWCLFVKPGVAYPGEALRLELRLANEDALPPGRYPVTVAVVGPHGRRWSEDAEVEIPREETPFALPVLEREIPADGPAGVYQCAASMGRAAAPAAGRATFHVVRRPAKPRLEVRPRGMGLAEEELDWLSSAGVDCRGSDPADTRSELFVLGHPAAVTGEALSSLRRAIEGGATGLVFCPWELIPGTETEAVVPLGEGIICAAFHDWLYHKECFSKPHVVFDDLPSPGLMDWGFYGEVVPRHLLQGTRPSDVAAVAFAIGHPCPGGYVSGVLTGTYQVGRGHLVVSCFDLLERVGSSAVADILAINHVRYAARLAGRRIVT
jgi:hypothetical protein